MRVRYQGGDAFEQHDELTQVPEAAHLYCMISVGSTLMPASRLRQIVRRALMVLAGVLLLWGGYISSVAVICFAVNAGALPIDPPESPLFHRYIGPAVWYTRSELPGSYECGYLIGWACFEGYRMAGQQLPVR